MRALWVRYGQPVIGVPEGGVEALASELSGVDLAPFFRDFVYGTKDLPLGDLLHTVGIRVQTRRSLGDKDKGGKPARVGLPATWLGARFAGGGDLRVSYVANESPAERAGMSAGDTIVALDGLRASPEAIAQLLSTRKAGDVAVVHVFRRDELMVFQVTLEAAPEDTCWLALDEGASAEARLRRAAWLAATG